MGFSTLALLICALGAIYIGNLRPFAPETHSAAFVPTRVSASPPAPTGFSTEPTPTDTPTPLPTPTPPASTPSTPITAAPTASPTPTATPSPTATAHTATPTPNLTRTAYARRVGTSAANVPLETRLTQTAVLAVQTFSAIQTRAFATPTPTPGPSPTPRAIDQTTNFLLLGIDLRPQDPTWVSNTDVIMVVFLDRANSRVGVLSLPRDLVVAIPRRDASRINAAYPLGEVDKSGGGGAALLKRVLRDEFNIRIDHWGLVDFDGFQKIIDTLGGIDLHVPCALEDTIDEQHFVIPAGDVHMDYLTAKRYVQSRYTTSDTSRNIRQQRVLWAIVKKGLQTNALDKLPTLWGQLHDAVLNDMTLFEMLSLAPTAYGLDLQNHPERVRATVLEYPVVYPWVAPSGAWFYMPNYVEIDDALDHIFDAPVIAPARGNADECLSFRSATTPSAPSVTPTP